MGTDEYRQLVFLVRKPLSHVIKQYLDIPNQRIKIDYHLKNFGDIFLFDSRPWYRPYITGELDS